jgi:hypothetical protein
MFQRSNADVFFQKERRTKEEVLARERAGTCQLDGG